MFKWEKIGRVFNPEDHKREGWLNEFAQAPSTLIYDAFVRVFFSCRPKADSKGQYVSYSGFVDFDRADLTKVINVSSKPILSLGNRGTFDEFGTYPVSVIKDHNKYLAYYAGWTRCESVPFNVAIGVAASLDGASFERYGTGPILSYTPDEPFILSGPKIRRFNNKFYLFYIAGKRWVLDNGKPEPIYTIRLAESTDGFNWIKKGKDLIAPRIENDEAQASPDVFFYNGKYHMFFCYRHSKNYRGKDFGYRIGYASSENLYDWERDDSKAGITVSDGDEWDSEMVSYPHVFELDGQVYMFYLGNQVGKHGFGLAKLIDYKS